MLSKPRLPDLPHFARRRSSPEMATTVFELAKQVEDEFCGQFSNIVNNTDAEETYREV